MVTSQECAQTATATSHRLYAHVNNLARSTAAIPDAPMCEVMSPHTSRIAATRGLPAYRSAAIDFDRLPAINIAPRCGDGKVANDSENDFIETGREGKATSTSNTSISHARISDVTGRRAERHEHVKIPLLPFLLLSVFYPTTMCAVA